MGLNGNEMRQIVIAQIQNPKPMKKLIAFMLLIIVILIPLRTFPTCIIILRNAAGDVYIIADRMAVYTKDGHSSLDCKLFQHGKYYYAVVGCVSTKRTNYIINGALDLSILFGKKLDSLARRLEFYDSL